MKILQHIILILSLITLQACKKDRKNRKGTRGVNTSAIDSIDGSKRSSRDNLPDRDKGKKDSILLLKADRGLKNASQIYRTYLAATRIPESPIIQQAYADNVDSLPNFTNDLRGFSASQEAAALKLATVFCDELFKNATERVTIVSDAAAFDGAASALSAANKKALVEQLMNRFWGEVSTGLDRGKSATELTELYDDLATVAATGSAAMTGVCATVAISLPALSM